MTGPMMFWTAQAVCATIVLGMAVVHAFRARRYLTGSALAVFGVQLVMFQIDKALGIAGWIN